MTNKPRVGVDVDGVLADLLSPLFSHMNTMLGTRYTPDHMKDWDIAELVPEGRRDEFWDSFGKEVRVHDALRPLPGAVEGMQLLAEVADVYIVTAYLRSAPTWVHDRDRWLAEHFAISDKRIVHTHAKYTFSAKALVDDKPATVAAWQREFRWGFGVLWDQPYNQSANALATYVGGGAWNRQKGPAQVRYRMNDWGALAELVAQ